MARPVEGILATQKYSFYLLFVLKFLWMSEDTSKLWHFLWECISWFSVFVPLYMAFCFFKTVYDRFQMDSIATLSNVGIQGLWLFCSFITMLNYKLKAKDLRDIIEMIENQFEWRSPRGKTYVNMEKIHNIAKYLALFWQLTTASSVVGSLLRPLFSRPIQLPIQIWYPINENNNYQFAVAYLLQAWAQIITVCSFAVGSTFYFSFGLLCSGQFNILRCGLKNLVFTSGVYKRFPETLQMNQVQDSTEYLFAVELNDNFLSTSKLNVGNFDEATKFKRQRYEAYNNLRPDEIRNFREALKKCVNLHITLLKLCDMMEKFWNFFAILRVLEVTLQMCFMAFVFVKNPDIFILLFGVLAAMDLFLLTYSSEFIREQNNLIGPSLVKGPWYLVSKYFRNDFLIILAYSQKPIYFTAGKILILNADRLRQAITTAFSYYTLLSSFDQNA